MPTQPSQDSISTPAADSRGATTSVSVATDTVHGAATNSAIAGQASARASQFDPVTGDPVDFDAWASQVRELARARDAIILAHNYQVAAIQDVADHVGDSLALSRIAATAPQGDIVFCGVHFMAETAKILSPDKRVLIPDARAGCSLADTIDATELAAWKSAHPHAIVVSYVNTSAEVKALTDVCCTSSNAVDVVNSIESTQEILFLPDRHLGAHVARMTGRTNMKIWQGQCHVHQRITAEDLTDAVKNNPDADVLVHPECACATPALQAVADGVIPADRLLMTSTGQMATHVPSSAAKKVLVATETGMLHQLRKRHHGVDYQAVNPSASCRYMKMITPERLLNCLLTGRDEVDVPTDIADRARASVERMIAIGTPSPTGE